MENQFTQIVETAVGPVVITAGSTTVTSIELLGSGVADRADTAERPNELTRVVAAEIREYFDGTRTAFDVPLEAHGTPFQEAVWQEIAKVPTGSTTTYAAIASAIGRPTAVRAVGGAVGANPLPLLIGCHRVLASDGRITGYSAGDGIPTKKSLLDLEGASYR